MSRFPVSRPSHPGLWLKLGLVLLLAVVVWLLRPAASETAVAPPAGDVARAIAPEAAAPGAAALTLPAAQQQLPEGRDFAFNTLSFGDGQDEVDELAWGDMDGDGDLDVVVANRAAPGGRIYFNENGRLQSQPAWSAQPAARAVAVGDADGDGDLDLALGRIIYLNRGFDQNGRLTFANAATLPQTQSPWSLAWGDLDGDGFLDLVAGYAGQGDLTDRIYLNRPSPSDPQKRVWVEGWASPDKLHSVSVALADADGDGDLDLAVGAATQSVDLSAMPDDAFDRIYLNEGINGDTLSLEETWRAPAALPTQQVLWGDLDGDMLPDLATAGGNLLTGSDCDATVDRGNRVYTNLGLDELGELDMQLAWETPDCKFSQSVAWGDPDSDGDNDLVFNNEGVVVFHENLGGFLADDVEVLPGFYGTSIASLAWGDVNADGFLDLVLAVEAENLPLFLRALVNRGAGLDDEPAWDDIPTGEAENFALAWGDIDNDGDLDLAIGRNQGFNTVYRNDGFVAPDGTVTETLQLTAVWDATIDPWTHSLAWGDADGDGDLDLAVGIVGVDDAGTDTSQRNRVYLNQLIPTGAFDLEEAWVAPEAEDTVVVAWADVDGDGDLDFTAANGYHEGKADRVYLNGGLDSAGNLILAQAWESPETVFSLAMAWGDLDNDGDLDLAVGGDDGPSRVYRNAGLNSAGNLVMLPVWNSASRDRTFSLAWGDFDGDGDLDLAEGNLGDDKVFLNTGSALSTLPAWISPDATLTLELNWVDIDGDGDLDLAAGNERSTQIYHNSDGVLQSDPDKIWSLNQRADVITWGDVDGDGDADAAMVVDDDVQIILNRRQGQFRAVNQPSHLHLWQPNGGANQTPLVNATGYASPVVLDERFIEIPFTVYDRESDPVVRLEAAYSLDGGGHWRTAALTATITETTNLATSPTGVEHTLVWDTFLSGVLGSSDNVVFRVRLFNAGVAGNNVAAGTFLYPNSVGAVYERPFVSAVTQPFRVQGTQVRVVDHNGQPIAGASVYRLPAGEATGAQLMPRPESPQRTTGQGYLPGGGVLNQGDQLVALLPTTPIPRIDFTSQFHYYLTSAAPTTVGLDMHTVADTGTISLTIPTGAPETRNPLFLLDLTVSTEWDVSDDAIFMLEMEESFKRASELLYDVTNGQMAIGRVHVFPAKTYWNRADIVIYATNNIRPSAAIGGITDRPLGEKVRPGVGQPPTRDVEKAYIPGQIRMGTAWDPFGDSAGDLGEQWWRALAHEIAHHALFLPDNYIGLKQADPNDPSSSVFLGRVDCQGSFMTTTRDPSYTEFLNSAQWLAAGDVATNDCLQSLAENTTGRDDWATIARFYPTLKAPAGAFEGPSVLPLDVTHMVPWTLLDGQTTLPARNFDIRNANGDRVRLPGAQVYLFQTQGTPDPTDDVLISLGSPTAGGDRVRVRGALAGDRLCLFDFSRTTETFAGCIDSLSGANVSIPVVALQPAAGEPRWAPQIALSAVTTRTLSVRVTPPLPGVTALKVQLFPSHYPSAPGIAPVADLPLVNGQAYEANVNLTFPASDISVRVWVDQPGDLREAITQIFVQLPFAPNDVLVAGPDYPIIGGGDRPIIGGGDRPIIGGPDRPIIGGPDYPIIGGGDRPIIGGPDRPIIGGGDRPIIGGGDYPIIGGAPGLEFDAPALSADSQVVIYDQRGLFEPSGIRSIQILPAPPELADEAWLFPVGQAYFVDPDPLQPAARTIAFNYLQRDVPEGFEHTLAIYYLPQGGQTWERLLTRQFVENLVVADLKVDAGTYAVMSTIVMPPLQPGWNLMAYPLPDSRTVTEVLASIQVSVTKVVEATPQSVAVLTGNAPTDAGVVNRITTLVNLNVRSGPGFPLQTLVGNLPAGTSATVLETDAATGWRKIVCPASVTTTNDCWVSGSAAFSTLTTIAGAAGSAAAAPFDLATAPVATQFEFGRIYWIQISGSSGGPSVTPFLAPPRRSPDGVVPGQN